MNKNCSHLARCIRRYIVYRGLGRVINVNIFFYSYAAGTKAECDDVCGQGKSFARLVKFFPFLIFFSVSFLPSFPLPPPFT